jgi:hypothetical protein
MFRSLLICLCLAVALSACAPKQCRNIQNVLVMPTAYSTERGAGTAFGSDFQNKLSTALEERFKKIKFVQGFTSTDTDIIVRTVLVNYSEPIMSDNIIYTGTGHVEVSLRIFTAKGSLIQETYITRDLNKGTKEEVVTSIVEEAVKFVDRECL